MRRNLGDRKCAIRGQSPIFWLSRYFTVLYLIVPLLPAHSTTDHTVLYRSLALAVAFMRRHVFIMVRQHKLLAGANGVDVCCCRTEPIAGCGTDYGARPGRVPTARVATNCTETHRQRWQWWASPSRPG